MYYPQFNNNYGFNQSPFNQYMQQQQPQQQVVKVHGEEGARAYNLAPNSSALLLDETEPILFLAQTDGAGYKTISAYTIAPAQKEVKAEVNYNEKFSSLESRIIKLEERLNNESNTKRSKRNEATESNDTVN